MRRPSGPLWSHPDFLKLWTGQTISEFGSQVSQLAIPAVAVLTLEATPFQVAALETVVFLPFLILTLPAGVWVDRWRRRWVLIGGDLGRAVRGPRRRVQLRRLRRIHGRDPQARGSAADRRAAKTARRALGRSPVRNPSQAALPTGARNRELQLRHERRLLRVLRLRVPAPRPDSRTDGRHRGDRGDRLAHRLGLG